MPVLSSVKIFFWGQNGQKAVAFEIPIGNQQKFVRLSSYPDLCQSMGLARLIGRYFFGATSYGSVFLYRHDQQTWAEIDTACHFLIRHNSYLLIKRSELIEDLPGFQDLACILRPNPIPIPDTAPLSLQRYHHLEQNHPGYLSAPLPTTVYTYLQVLQTHGILGDAMGLFFYNDHQELAQPIQQYASFNKVIIDTTPLVHDLVVKPRCSIMHWNAALDSDIVSLPDIPIYKPFRPDQPVELQLFYKISFRAPLQTTFATVFADGCFAGSPYLTESQLRKVQPHQDRRVWPDNFFVSEILRGVALMDKVDKQSQDARFSYIFKQPPPNNLSAELTRIRSIRRRALQRYGDDGIRFYIQSKRSWTSLASDIRYNRSLEGRMWM